MFSSKLRCPNP